jgi:hypothetical protein
MFDRRRLVIILTLARLKRPFRVSGVTVVPFKLKTPARKERILAMFELVENVDVLVIVFNF